MKVYKVSGIREFHIDPQDNYPEGDLILEVEVYEDEETVAVRFDVSDLEEIFKLLEKARSITQEAIARRHQD